MLVLGIETSCDETGVALYDSERGLVAECLYSQVEMHADYGGVVPELASRDHVRKLIPLIDEVFKKSGLSKQQLDGIAYTQGPGLAGALLVGSMTARSMAMALNIPAIGVHHMEGHLLAPMLEDEPPQFPFVALLVSGGHTQLVLAKTLGDYQLLGESLDDAAGEAFDKAAKMMSLSYPGGPAIAKLAAQYDPKKSTMPALVFPRPMTNKPGLDFSFSGLKTFTLNTLESYRNDQGELPDVDLLASIAHAFQEAVVQTIAIKCCRALQQTGRSTLVLAGGVAANQRLREWLPLHLQQQGLRDAKLYYPQMQYCTDNGAMIAYAGCQRLMLGQRSDLAVEIKPRWSLESL